MDYQGQKKCENWNGAFENEQGWVFLPNCKEIVHGIE